MTEFKKGDRVRVTYEGVVEGTWDGLLGVRLDDGGCRTLREANAVLVERAKPTLKPGDVVTRAAFGGGVGTYLVGSHSTAYTTSTGDVVTAQRREHLERLIAENPGKYTINGEVFE